MAITMTELAKQLNISQSTVSLVLNNRDSGRVRPEVAEKVRTLARETGFRLNRAASDLRRRCYKTIGVSLAFSLNPHRTELVLELNKEILRCGYRPLFTFHSRAEEQQGATDLLLSNNLDAIITLEPKLLPDILDLPVTSFFHQTASFDAVVLDHEAGLRMELDYLKKLGHQRISWIGMADNDIRANMLPSLVQDYNLQLVTETSIKHEDINSFIDQKGALSFFSSISPDKLPTAILCHNDLTAFCVYQRLFEIGLKVPDNIGVIGHDNSFLCEQMIPRLTSLSYASCATIAEKLVQSVLSRLADPEIQRQVITLSPQLHIRDSIVKNNQP